MTMNKEQQFDFYWKEIFTGLAYNPIEFNKYRFDQSMSLPSKFNKLYEMFKQLALNNQEVMDYLKQFVETFDEKMYGTIEDVLETWLNEGNFDEIIVSVLNQFILEIRNEMTTNTENIADLQKRLAIIGGELNLDYKTVSSTVTPYQLENGLSNDTIDHLLFQGADSVLCLMVSIDNDNSFTFSKMSDNIITTQIERAIQKGLKISMLKPHIGINFSDGYYRKNYNPSNMSSCFTNWFDVLEDYANMCVKYNIPILSIGCEQYEMTNNIHFDLWNTHINRLRLKFPTLLFTYAFDSVEWYDDEHTDMMKLLDIIGVNLYQTFTTKMIGEKITVEELKESLSFALFADEFSNPKVKRRPINRLKELHSLYEKNIFITEFGTMSYRDSLISHVSNLMGVEDNGYYEAQALCFETILTVLPRYSFICGVSIWHTAEPFNYFSSTMITEAERTLKNLFEVIK